MREVTRTRFKVRELGAIDMVSMALATLDLATHHDEQATSPAAYLDGHTVLSHGDLAGLAGESGRVLRHDGKALDNGQAGPYWRLAGALGEEFAVSGVQAGGLYSGAEPRRTVSAMAAVLGDVRALVAIDAGLHQR